MFSGIDVASLWSAIVDAAEQASFAVYLARIDVIPATIVYASARAGEIAGQPPEALIGRTPWSFLTPEDQALISSISGRPLSEVPVKPMDLTVLRPDGTTVPIRLGRTRIAAGTQLYSFGYFRDLSIERDATEALRRSEARFRSLVEAAPDGVVILERGRIAFINKRGAQLLANAEIEDVLGRPVGMFLPPDDAAAAAERIAQMFASGAEMPPNDYRVLVDAERFVEIKSIVVEWDGAPAVLAFARDATERKRLQLRLVEHDRLAALGTLSAGVAHEINNPLTYATLGLQRIDRALQHLGVSEDKIAPLRTQLREVEHGLSRVASITRGLRSFARADDAPPGPVALGEVVERSLKMVDNDLRHRAELVRQFADVPPVTGNASRLEQVVVNVLLNAIQSLKPDTANTIALSIAHVGANVVLTIRDTGRGIPAPLRARIFEPFFTTRAVGEGMGLGLSVCRTIIEGFGGTIELGPESATGTVMVIALPVHRNSAPALPPPLVAPVEVARKRVLVIDDEPLLRDALTRLLGPQHEITTASSGTEGLAAVAMTPFDAIVCDVMMPFMNGQEVHRRIATIRPGLERRIVFITGGTFSPELDDFLATTPNRLLSKPFALDDVIAAVEEAANA